MAEKDSKKDVKPKNKQKDTFITEEKEHELKEKELEKAKREEEERIRREQEREEKERIELEKKRIEEEKARERQEQALLFDEYIEQSGLKYTFQIIFTEIIAKQITVFDVV